MEHAIEIIINKDHLVRILTEMEIKKPEDFASHLLTYYYGPFWDDIKKHLTK